MSRLSMSDPNLEWALAYASIGFRVFPVRRDKTPLTPDGFKSATTDTDQIRSWWGLYPDAGIGVATGRESGIVVLDVDLEKPGTDESLRSLVHQKGQFNQDVVCQTGGGGYHFYFRHPGNGRDVPNASRLYGLPGIDVRGDGGYVVVPPSLHNSGNRYEWGDNQSPFDSAPGDCPEFMYLGRNRARGFDFTSTIGEGERNITLTSIAGLLRSFGLGRQEIQLVLQSQNRERCNPPLPDSEIDVIVDHIIEYPPFNNRGGTLPTPRVALQELLRFERNDTGYARMIAFALANRVRYNHSSGRWMLWREHWWETDQTEEIYQLVIEVADLYAEATSLITNEEERQEAMKFARRLKSKAQIESSLSLARSESHIATTSEVWDQNPDILCVENGVVDLRTGELRAGLPTEFLSTHAPIVFDPNAKCPRWMQFLSEVFEGNVQMMDFVHRAVGYSLTGHLREQCLFLLIGNGANGKSVFLDVIRSMLGPYGFPAPFSTFERTTVATSVSNDLARLHGKRLVCASETNEGVSFHEARIKSLTGGEAISARFLHQEFFEFKPVCTLWIGVNHLPRVHDDSEGFWRRVRRVDFKVQFSESRRDPELLDKLKIEYPGILAWAVRGAQLWYQQGLQTPESVKSATRQYREDSDPLNEFKTSYTEDDPGSFIHVDEFYRCYTAFCRDRQLKAYEILSSTRVRARMDREYSRERQSQGEVYIGIALTSEARSLLAAETPMKISITRREASPS